MQVLVYTNNKKKNVYECYNLLELVIHIESVWGYERRGDLPIPVNTFIKNGRKTEESFISTGRYDNTFKGFDYYNQNYSA